METAIQMFKIGECSVRMVPGPDDNCWFVRQDIEALFSVSCANIDEDFVSYLALPSAGGIHTTAIVSESAIYDLIMSSDKPHIEPARLFLVDIMKHPRRFDFDELFALIKPLTEWRMHRKTQRKVYKHARRARKANCKGEHTSHQIETMLKCQNGKCYYCGSNMGLNFTEDHVVPLSRGGTNGIDNIVLCCRKCNSSKNSKMLHEWSKGGRIC